MTDSEAVVNVSSWMDRGVSRLVHGPLRISIYRPLGLCLSLQVYS